MKIPYKILKMKSGEEIIASVRKTKDGKLKLYRPMVFKSMVTPDIFGMMKEVFMLKNWLILSSETETIISLDSVNAILNPTKEVSFLYENEKNKDDKYAQKPKQINPEIMPKYSQDVSVKKPINEEESLHDIRKKIEEMIEDLTNFPEEDSNLKDFAKPKSHDKMVYMNMIFSPEVIVDLFKAGILDRKDFGELVNEITNTNGEGMNPNKFTGNKKDKKNFGNDWTDWNPNPESEDYK